MYESLSVCLTLLTGFCSTVYLMEEPNIVCIVLKTSISNKHASRR